MKEAKQQDIINNLIEYLLNTNKAYSLADLEDVFPYGKGAILKALRILTNNDIVSTGQAKQDKQDKNVVKTYRLHDRFPMNKALCTDEQLRKLIVIRVDGDVLAKMVTQ